MKFKTNHKKANAIVASLLVTLLVITVLFSIVGIYINKMYSLKNLNDYYDKQIVQQLQENSKSKEYTYILILNNEVRMFCVLYVN